MDKIKLRLYVLVLAVTLPFIIYISTTSYQNIQSLKQSELDKLSTIARLTATEHKQIQEGARQLLIALSSTPDIKDGNKNKCNIFLSNLQKNYIRYQGFGVANRDGKIICSSSLDTHLNSPIKQELIDQTLNHQSFSLGTYNPLDGKESTINYAYPLSNNSVVYASLSLSWVADFVENLNIASPELVTNILDQNGTVLARKPNTEQAIGQNFATDPLVKEILSLGSGQTTKIGIDNILRLYSFTALDDDRNIFVAIGVPQTLLLQSLTNSLIASIFTIIIVIIISSILATKIGQALIIKQVESLQKIDRLKDDFVSLASHQLRSPMTAIRWLSESLLTDNSRNLSKKQMEHVNKIHLTTLRLIHLTSSLLNISRLESNSLNPHFKQVLFTEIINPILNETRPTATKLGLKVAIKSPKNLSLTTDPNLLSEVIHVLISNAIKYSYPHQKVTVSVAKEMQETSIKVTNRGIGIPSAAKDQIFTRFYRADNARSHRPDGNGLGLYLARLITKKLHGDITYKSNKAYTTFSITLPNAV